MDITTVETYLEKYEWNFRREELDVIITDFSTDDTKFMIIIQLAEPWLRISIPTFMQPVSEENWSKTVKELLKLNYHSRAARFSLDENSLIVLCLDLYVGAGELLYEHFEAALDTISYFAETSYPYILLAAVEAS